MTQRYAKKLALKANKKHDKEIDNKVKSVVKTLKSDIKRAAKKGIRDLRVKVVDETIYGKVRGYFSSKGFYCWDYVSADCTYLAIEW